MGNHKIDLTPPPSPSITSPDHSGDENNNDNSTPSEKEEVKDKPVSFTKGPVKIQFSPNFQEVLSIEVTDPSASIDTILSQTKLAINSVLKVKFRSTQ